MTNINRYKQWQANRTIHQKKVTQTTTRGHKKKETLTKVTKLCLSQHPTTKATKQHHKQNKPKKTTPVTPIRSSDHPRTARQKLPHHQG